MPWSIFSCFGEPQADADVMQRLHTRTVVIYLNFTIFFIAPVISVIKKDSVCFQIIV